MPEWQRAQARLVLSRVVGAAEARALCLQAYGRDTLPGRQAEAPMTAHGLRAQLLEAAASGKKVTEALGAADPATAAAALRGLRHTSVPGHAVPALQLVARASDGAATQALARGSEGTPLPADLAERFAATVGHDATGAARIHTGPAADDVAAAHHARAVTVGNDIYFARGELAPGTERGDELLAHELAHVAQSRRGELYRAAAKGIESGSTLDPAEAEADLQAKVAVLKLHPPQQPAPPLAAPQGQPTSDGQRQAQLAAQQQRIQLAQQTGPAEPSAAAPPASSPQAPVAHAPPAMTPAPAPKSTGNAYVDTMQAPPSKQATELWDHTGNAATTQAAADSAKFDAELKPMPVVLDGSDAKNAKGGAGNHAAKQPPAAGQAPPAAQPTPTPTAPPVTAGAAAVQSVKSSDSKEQLKADGQKAIDNLPTQATNVQTNPGPAPVTDLAGQADPARSMADQQHAQTEGSDAFEAEKKKVLAGPGAAQVQPLKLDQKLDVPKPAAEGAMPGLPTVEGMAKMKKWNLPSNVQDSFDTIAKPKMDATLADAKAKMTEAQSKRDTDRTKAVHDAQDKVKQAHAEADKQQQQKVAETRTQISNHQADTLSKQESEVKKLDAQAGDKKKATVGKVNQRIQSDQSKVEGDYQNAQKQAEDEKKKGEDDAAKKKADAQQKSKKDESWWEKAADAICDDIKAIADEIDKVLDAVVAAVGKILDAVKDAACKVIDAARDFVCAALTEFGDWLKSAVTALIGSVFPELAAELNRMIDAAVNAAKAAVNFIADKLKQGVTALCDGLKGAIDGIIAAFKAAVQAAATFAQAVVTGDWSKVGKMILDGILKLLGIDPGAFYALIGKAEDSIDKIIENPGAFVGHLVDAVKLGFKQFGANFWNHLKDGLVQWLFGTFAEAGIHMPASFDIAGIFDLVAQVLGLTWTRLRGKVVKIIGEKNTERLEFVAKYVQALVTGGFAGLWEKIKQDASQLWDMVIGGVKQWIIEKVVQQAIIKIATMWNPAGAIIQLIETAWNVYQWVRENAQRIFGLIQAVVDSISNIVAGNISGAANFIEASLAKLVPMAISLFADLLGLGGIADKIRGIIEKVQDTIDKAIDKLIARVMGMFKGKDGDGKESGHKDGEGADGDGDKEHAAEEGLSMHGESHTVYAQPNPDGSVEVQMASANRGPILAKIDQCRKLADELAKSPNKKGAQKGKDLQAALEPLELDVQKLKKPGKKKQEEIQALVDSICQKLIAIGQNFEMQSLSDAADAMKADDVAWDTQLSVPAFNCNTNKYDSNEYRRQVQLQEDGCNSQTVATWEKYRAHFKLYGRSEEGAKLQDKMQRQFGRPNKGQEEDDKVAALHGQDQIAGGAPDPNSLGHKGINSSIGSQWAKAGRVETLDNAVNDFKAKRTAAGLKNEEADLKKFQMNVKLRVVDVTVDSD